MSDRFRNAEQAVQDAVHPVVIRHPDTGRRVLYVNPIFTVHFDGWTEEESRPLLDFLYTHAARPEFSCRVRWEKGSLGLWDNRATWHMALNDYHGHRRLMHRVTIEGSSAFALEDMRPRVFRIDEGTDAVRGGTRARSLEGHLSRAAQGGTTMPGRQVIGDPVVIGGRTLSLSRAVRAGDFVFLTGQVPLRDGLPR